MNEWMDERFVRWCVKIAPTEFHFGTFIKRLRINVTKERLKMLLLCRDIINHLLTLPRNAEDVTQFFFNSKNNSKKKKSHTA